MEGKCRDDADDYDDENEFTMTAPAEIAHRAPPQQRRLQLRLESVSAGDGKEEDMEYANTQEEEVLVRFIA